MQAPRHRHTFRCSKSNYKKLAEQAKEFGMKRVCIFDEEYVKPLKNELFGTGTEILTGMEGLCALASDDTADITFNSVVGMVGLKPTIAALESGLDVARPAKERCWSLVSQLPG